VIATPISGIVELVVDGENGLLVEPDNVDELAAAIEKLARAPKLRRQFALSGEQTVRSRFDHKAAVVELLGLVGETLKRTSQVKVS
jgi:glycosyltransferase involved in cell wall biosynthesis